MKQLICVCEIKQVNNNFLIIIIKLEQEEVDLTDVHLQVLSLKVVSVKTKCLNLTSLEKL